MAKAIRMWALPVERQSLRLMMITMFCVALSSSFHQVADGYNLFRAGKLEEVGFVSVQTSKNSGKLEGSESFSAHHPAKV